jgi:hypothetical protein
MAHEATRPERRRLSDVRSRLQGSGLCGGGRLVRPPREARLLRGADTPVRVAAILTVFTVEQIPHSLAPRRVRAFVRFPPICAF